MSSHTLTLYYSLHGVNLAISCDPAAAAALHSRLKYFATGNCDSPDLTFEFYSVPDGGNHIVERPQGPTRAVYEPPVGEVVYAEVKDQLYIDYGDRVRVLCDFASGQAWVSSLECERHNLWLLTHPIFTLTLIEFLKRRAYYALHAAALSIDKRCLLLAGTSGAGKSTLTLALLRAGFGFLSDDLIFLQKSPVGIQALAFPEEIDVTDETVRLFPELHDLLKLQQPHGWRKRQISAESAYKANIVLKCQPAVLVFPRVADAEKSVLEPMMADEAFLELVPNVMLTEAHSSQAHLDVLAELVRQCACYCLETGRDLNTVPLKLRELVEL